MIAPMFILGLFSIFGGMMGVKDYLEEYFPKVHSGDYGGILSNSAVHALLVSTASLAAVVAGFYVYSKRRDIPEKALKKLRPLHEVLSKKYMMDEIYDAFIVKPFMIISKIFGLIDKWVVDGAVNLSAYLVRGVSFMASKIQTGYVQVYAFFLITGLIIIMGYLFWIG